MHSNGTKIKITKLKQDYTYYNSWERPKTTKGFMKNAKKLKLKIMKSKLKGNKDRLIQDDEFSNWKILIENSDKSHKNQLEMKNYDNQHLSRGRTMLEKNKSPKDRFSRKFFSEEKYHYSQNFQIEDELDIFKKVRKIITVLLRNKIFLFYYGCLIL